MSETRQITVNALTRVEGEGALHVRVEGDTIEDVRLSIYEPPRFFEALLRGRAIEEVPDITARICGICPIAYQMTSVHAIEKALGVEVGEEIKQLRRLLACGEWLESHLLHIYLLNAPDFFGCHSGIELAARFPDAVNRGLRMKKIGNRILEVVGGRAIHPINVRVGGFYRAPSQMELAAMLDDLRWALASSVDMTRWIAGFEFPMFDESCELVALRHASEYPMNEGQIASSTQPAIDVDAYERHFVERHVEHTTALQSERRDTGEPFLLGPLSRLSLNHETLAPTARSLARDYCRSFPMINRFEAILARSIEVVHAFEVAIEIIEGYQPPAKSFVAYAYRDGQGCAATEAPRGMIYHHYEITREGKVDRSNIIPPTSQNQKQMERDLRGYLPDLLDRSDIEIAAECEKLIRTYDPCISCSTHFLRLTMERH
jgi:sulfhydrogenase subunit alpha